MRVILFKGKGGVGKTTIAAAPISSAIIYYDLYNQHISQYGAAALTGGASESNATVTRMVLNIT